MVGPSSTAEPLGGESRPEVTPDVAAEAAVWVARLHGPSRSPRMERECLAWQARSAAHREGFERCTETWQDIPLVTVASAFAAKDVEARPEAAGFTRRWASALALAVVVAGSAVVLQRWQHEGAYSTGVGEQRRIVLADGTRLMLNTDTHLDVRLGSSQRTVALDHGEALFEVARDPQRPFLVIAGGSTVVAHGTAFSVRLAPADATRGVQMTVTLLEGRVSVQSAGGEGTGALSPLQPKQMEPGERVRVAQAPGLARQVTTQVDRPNLESVMAWQRGEAAFDDVSLAEAVAEMNRYNRTSIVLLDPLVLGPLRVSGLYRTDNSAGFARAVADLHGLTLKESQGRLELSKPQ